MDTTSPTHAPEAPTFGTTTTLTHERYGAPSEVLTFRRVDVPAPAADEAVVRVRATSVNALDWHLITGTPYIARLSLGLRRPRRTVPGAEVAGVVEAIGSDVTDLRPGDEVFGLVGGGGCAGLAVVPARLLVPRPAHIPLDASASLGVAALTALQGLRDWGGLRPGMSVLVNGASGGVGTFAVQIARALGADRITAVCSTRNVETVAALGADRVIDYTVEDFTETDDHYDIVFDNVGNRRLGALRGLLVRDGTLVMVTGPKGRWLAPLPRLAVASIRSRFWTQRLVNRTAAQSTDDLRLLAEMVDDGRVAPVIERRVPLEQAVDAFTEQGAFHARGKTLITIGGDA